MTLQTLDNRHATLNPRTDSTKVDFSIKADINYQTFQVLPEMAPFHIKNASSGVRELFSY